MIQKQPKRKIIDIYRNYLELGWIVQIKNDNIVLCSKYNNVTLYFYKDLGCWTEEERT